MERSGEEAGQGRAGQGGAGVREASSTCVLVGYLCATLSDGDADVPLRWLAFDRTGGQVPSYGLLRE